LQEMSKAEIPIRPDISAPNNAAAVAFRHQPLSWICSFLNALSKILNSDK
jgi:hypothetical protein